MKKTQIGWSFRLQIAKKCKGNQLVKQIGEKQCHQPFIREGFPKTLPKAQLTRGLSSAYLSNFGHIASFYTNLDQISSSESLPELGSE